MMVRPSVDLPQPDSPTRPSVSPFLISRSTPSTARTWAVVRCNTPDEIGNQVFNPCTDTSGSEAVQAFFSWTLAVSCHVKFDPSFGGPARAPLRLAPPGEHRGLPRGPPGREPAPGVP